MRTKTLLIAIPVGIVATVVGVLGGMIAFGTADQPAEMADDASERSVRHQ